MVITMIVAGVFYGGLKYLKVTQKRNMFQTMALQKSQKAINYFSKDLSFALGLDTTYLDSTYGYVNSDNTLCVSLPSIDNNGDIIEEDEDGNPVPLGTYIDYFYFYLDGTDLKRNTYVDLSAPSPIGRSNGTFTITENVTSLFFSDGATGLSSVADASALKTVDVALEVTESSPLGGNSSKSLSTRIFFRNKT